MIESAFFLVGVAVVALALVGRLLARRPVRMPVPVQVRTKKRR